jgi:hypothetical protein
MEASAQGTVATLHGLLLQPTNCLDEIDEGLLLSRPERLISYFGWYGGRHNVAQASLGYTEPSVNSFGASSLCDPALMSLAPENVRISDEAAAFLADSSDATDSGSGRIGLRLNI